MDTQTPRLLLINPNTTPAVTARVADAARAALPGVAIRAVTGRFGAAYISSRASFAVAGHAALDCLAAHWAGAEGAPPHVVLLACFGDPGLDALREVSSAPVIGLVEAACREACAGRRRYAIVTGGERWGPMLEEMIKLRGLSAGLAGIITVAPTGGQIAEDPEGALALLAETCARARAVHGAEAVILGGAGLIGLAARVAARIGGPIICSVEAGFRAARAAMDGDAARAPATTVATPSIGLSPALADMLAKGSLAP